MKTETANSLAMLLEIDRGTMLRALKNTMPDEERTPGRPKYKVATAARALESHRLRTGRADSRRSRGNGANIDVGSQDLILTEIYSELDAAEAAMRALPTLEGRRKSAIAMIPLIGRVDAATRERGKINSGDPDNVDMRADVLYQMTLRGLEEPCRWSHEETWATMSDVEG
jgi:hypothetical protein